MVDLMEHAGANPGRGTYGMAMAASRTVFEARRDCAALLGVKDPRDLFFVSGCTEACNLMLKGLLQPGDRVVVSSMEHNAVTRPLHVLSGRGVRVDFVTADTAGLVDAEAFERAVAEAPTRAIVCQHASNVTGTIQPIGDLADIAHAAGALMLVDGAQGAGHLDVDVAALDVDAYACSGHKALLGPQGIGVLYLRSGLDAMQLVEGGTGASGADEPGQPLDRPERYEAGTPNTPGIAGLGAAARYQSAHGAGIRATERRLTVRLREALSAMDDVVLLGPAPHDESVPVVSFTSPRAEPDRIAFELDRRFGIAVRSGLHCAPWAHRTIGTLDTGALRIGIGHGTTDADIDALLAGLDEVLA